MADVEQQKIAVELRKFRKKLRQIEKLEDLKRELTDEEYFKLSKKDEVRSKVQQLVAREEELTSELQNMQSDSTHNEQASTEQEEQLGNETTQAHAQSSGEGPQEVTNENVLSESELTINDTYDQAPVLEPQPLAAVPDVVLTAPTRTAPIVTTNQTYMRFQVRNLQGHNDMIFGVDCQGSVLVSGRGNYHVHGSIERARIEKTVCKRKCVAHQQIQDQRLSSDSTMRTKRRRMIDGRVSSECRQLPGECRRRETDVEKENVRMIVHQSPDRRSDSSTRTKRQRTSNEVVSNANRQSRGESSKMKAPVIRKNVTGMVVDQRLSSDSRAKKQRLDNDISSSENHHPNAESSNRENAVTTEITDDITVVVKPLSFKKSIKSEKKGTLPGEPRQQKGVIDQGTAMSQNVADGMVLDVGEGIVLDDGQVPEPTLSSLKSDHVHLSLEDKETPPSEDQQLPSETSNQTAAMTESVDVEGTSVDRSQDINPVLSSTKSDELHLVFEDKETPPSENQQLPSETNNQTAVMTESVDVGGTGVDRSQDLNAALDSSKSDEVHLVFEDKETPPSENQQLPSETSNETAAMTESVNVEGSSVDRSQDLNPVLSSSESDELHLVFENKETLPSEHEQLQSENKTAVITENVGKVVIDQGQGPDQALFSSTTGQVHLASESKNLLSSHNHHLQAEISDQAAAITDRVVEGMDIAQTGQDTDERLPSRKSSHVDLKIETKGSLQNDHQHVLAAASKHTAAITEDLDYKVAEDRTQDQLPSSSKSDHVHVDSNQDPDPRLSASKSFQDDLISASYKALEKEQHVLTQDQLPSSSKSGHTHVDSLPGKHQEPQAATAVRTKYVDGGMVVDVCKDLDQSLSSRNSRARHLRYQNEETLLGEQQRLQVKNSTGGGQEEPQAQTRSHIAAITRNVLANQNQDPDPHLSACKSVQVDILSGSCAIAVKHQETQTGCSLERIVIAETAEEGMLVDRSHGPHVSSINSGQVHFSSDTKETSPSEHQQLKAGRGNQTAASGMAVDQSQVSEPSSSCSSKSGLTHLKTEMWKKFIFSTRILQGHNDLICGVDCRNSVLVSGGRDTMLKLWDADTGREMRSMGGHTGTITSVLLVPNKDMSSTAVPSSFRTDQYSVLTGSRDCSMKLWSLANGQVKRSMYAFSPVESLDCNGNNLVAAGLDGGKLELWDLESGTNVRSVRGPDEDAITAVKFQDNRVISGSATGVVKVWDIRDNSLKPVMSSDQTPKHIAAVNVSVKPRRVRCLATTQDIAYWGDDGVNIKAMDLKSGEVRKIRNHVTDFGTTGAMATTGSCLVSAGYDLDRGNGYLNVRNIPTEEYLATVDDECTGSITCLACTQTTRDKVTLHRMCTGGLELKLWDQLPSSKVKKRSRPETDDVYVTAKHLRRYSLPDISDTESSEDDDDQPEGDDSDDDDDVSSTGSASRSWCIIS